MIPLGSCRLDVSHCGATALGEILFCSTVFGDSLKTNLLFDSTDRAKESSLCFHECHCASLLSSLSKGEEVLPVKDAQRLQTGAMGSLFAISLLVKDNNQPRPGEEATQYQRILSVPPPMTTALMLYRFKIWWMRPKWGFKVPPETIFLLDDDASNGLYRLVLVVPLPSTGGKLVASSSLQSTANDDLPALLLCSNHAQTGLYIGQRRDLYALIQERAPCAVQVWEDEKRDELPTNQQSILCQMLGWCTWNASLLRVLMEGQTSEYAQCLLRTTAKFCLPSK